jgi:transcriptional regulator with XRE-family HTH domain
MSVLVWKTLRELTGLSQSAVVRRLGINQSHYSRLEREMIHSSTEMIAKLLSALPVPPALDALAVQHALESGRVPQDRVAIEAIYAALTRCDPSWVAETIRACFWGLCPVSTVSLAAQPGLLWLVWVGAPPPAVESFRSDIEPPSSLSSEQITNRWKTLLGTFPNAAEVIAAEGLGNLIHDPGALWQILSRPTWDALRLRWDRLTPQQQGLIATLMEELDRQ